MGAGKHREPSLASAKARTLRELNRHSLACVLARGVMRRLRFGLARRCGWDGMGARRTASFTHAGGDEHP